MKQYPLFLYLGIVILILGTKCTDLYTWVPDQTFTVGSTPRKIVPATSYGTDYAGPPESVSSNLSPLNSYCGMNGNTLIKYEKVSPSSS